MSFTHKVTARNILRYKKRFYMTVIGIAGCCALLVTGFGLRDSIHDIVDKQFGEIYNYNLSIHLKENGSEESDETIKAFLEDTQAVESYAMTHMETGSVSNDEGSCSVTVLVPKVTEQLEQQITLRDRESGQPVEFHEDSVILTEKLCETLKVKVGDSVSVKNTDGKTAELTVSGISENYVMGYVFLSASEYESAFGQKPEYLTALVQVRDQSEASRNDISKRILSSDNIMMLQFSQSIRDSFSNTVKNIDYIVVVLIIAAGLLAMIVLYNLTNINICERIKELATIKVLGFHEREVASYIYRETNILCLIGIVVGFGLGVALHAFVVKSAEIDSVMFGREIYWQSFLFAALVTLFFTVVVDLVMLRKLKNIDMVESMKANE